MPTVTKSGFLFILILLAQNALAQHEGDKVDTVHIHPFERYWTKSRLVPKVGFGVQETGFGELGVQLHQIYVHPLSLASRGPYFTMDGVFQTDEIILGPKFGYEFTAGLLGLAADVTYYSDFDNHEWMTTPKAGLSLFGYVNLFYGYNISLSDYNFKAISKNRFSLTFNLNPDYHHIHDAAKKRRRPRE
jgi:hypothetical protein